MELGFLSTSLSFLLLLLVSFLTYVFTKKINFPYTVGLLLVGLLLIPLSKIESLSFINHFKLTPDILFYVFLPILIFESAYNMNYKQMLKSWKSITILSVIGLLISTFVIALLMFYLLPIVGFNIPFLVCLLFGGLISATDPVAVLSIFKTIGAPRRLTLIFEGESLFNDGTALALFLVILGIILEGTGVGIGSVFSGTGIFLSMAIGGILYGALLGVFFSKIIGNIRNNEVLEIALTMILAHITFITSEIISKELFILGHQIHISGVIATTIAGIIVGNYGRYKISPKVEKHMNQFWEFFAFISNSLVFILMGLTLSYIQVDFSKFIYPIIIVVLIVILARFVSIYLPVSVLNLTKSEEKIPNSWQFLLSWGSLRGALALMMALMIPGVGEENYEKIKAFQESVGWNFSFDIKDFILVITISCIMFTLFIKATTIGYFMRKFKITKLHELEEFEYYESSILAYLKMLEKLDNIHQKNYITPFEVQELKNKYELKLSNSINDLKSLLGTQKTDELLKRAISLHALGIEKQYLKELFENNEIDLGNFKYILNKIDRQIERLESQKPQLKAICEESFNLDVFQKFMLFFSKKRDKFIDKYISNRTKAIITRKVIKELTKLSEIDFGFDKKVFSEIIEIYKGFNKTANEKKDLVYTQNTGVVSIVESKLADKSLLKLQESVIKDLYSKEIITPKLYIKFMEEIEDEIYSDLNKIY